MSRLVVGAGRNFVKREGDVTLDIKPFDGIDIVMDLNLPWTLTPDSYHEIMAYHVVEHLDSLIHFMDEAWKVLKPGGVLHIETPLAGGNPELEWADPTHKRCYTTFSFINYFTPEGIDNFGYTDKAWAIEDLYLKTIDPDLWDKPDVVVFRGIPIK